MRTEAIPRWLRAVGALLVVAAFLLVLDSVAVEFARDASLPWQIRLGMVLVALGANLGLLRLAIERWRSS